MEVPPRGRRGGILVAWKQGVVVDVQVVCNFFVNFVVLSNPTDRPWLLSFVYGPTLLNEKVQLWYDLDREFLYQALDVLWRL